MSTITSVFGIQTGVITKEGEETVTMSTFRIGTHVMTNEGQGTIVKITPLPAVANEEMLGMFGTQEIYEVDTQHSTVMCKVEFIFPYINQIFSGRIGKCLRSSILSALIW